MYCFLFLVNTYSYIVSGEGIGTFRCVGFLGIGMGIGISGFESFRCLVQRFSHGFLDILS